MLVSGVLLAVCGYWNIFHTYQAESVLPARETEELTLKERHLEPIRLTLLKARYHGEVGFVGRQDLQGLPWDGEDGKRWGQAQYVLLPWVLAHGKRDTPFVIGDFEDGIARDLPGYSTLFDDGAGLILYRAKQLP
jgi:hypothetical protein